MNFPETLRYTEQHEWVQIDTDGETVTIGISEFAQSELGDIVFVELEPIGDTLEKEEIFGSVEAVKAVSDLYMPIAGTIIAHNEALDSNPELVNKDPYGEGWMIKVRLQDADDWDDLLTADEYAAMVA